MSERLRTPDRRDIIIPRAAPNIDGFPLPIEDVSQYESDLDPENPYNYNNHHRLWTARVFGQYLIYQTLRDLDAYQQPALKDVHADYHRRYDPVTPPTPRAAIERLDDAFYRGELLRTGPLHQPQYEQITPEFYRLLKLQYELLR